MRHLALSACCLLLLAAEEPAPAELDLLLVCTAAVDGRDLQLHLAIREGLVLGGFADGYNAFPHELDCSALSHRDGRLQGSVRTVLAPDPWLPEDRVAIPVALSIDCLLADPPTGSYTGTVREQAVAGTITGTLKPPVDGADAALALRIHQAFFRLSEEAGTKGPNQGYALDMVLSCLRRAGAATMPRLETVVPDYRGYSATIHSYQLEQEGPRLRLRAEATLDSGDQGSDAVPRRERYRYELVGWAVGGRFGGQATITVGDLQGQRPVWGGIDTRPPPVAEGARAIVRLHAAMRQEWPVLLDLALHRDGLIHGLAYTPRYNHQPQPIDASGLELADGRLRGPLTIQVRPDCYHDSDVHFDLTYSIDAVIIDGQVRGSFTGRDGELETAGQLAGELRRKGPGFAALSELSTIELDLGYALPALDGKQGAVQARLEIAEDGSVAAGSIANPRQAEAWSATFDGADLRLEGSDRLLGDLRFTITGESAAAGSYRYRCEAMIDGDRLHGLWLGERDGKAVLTKSAKLGGAVERR